jgi:hypothetical protein
MTAMRKAVFYPHAKAFLEAQSSTERSEFGPAYVVPQCRDEPPLIVGLKTAINLTVILPGVAWQAKAPRETAQFLTKP